MVRTSVLARAALVARRSLVLRLVVAARPPAARRRALAGADRRRRPAAVAAYIPPVAGAVIVDHFRRARPRPTAAGNRGLDEVTAPGAPVVASAAGRGDLRRPGRRRAARHAAATPTACARATRTSPAIVVRGRRRGRAGHSRSASPGRSSTSACGTPTGTYLDPEALFGRPAPGPPRRRARRGRRAADRAPDRLESRRALGPVGGGGRRPAVGSRAGPRARALGHEALAVSVPVVAGSRWPPRSARWHDQQQHCTPADVAVPGPDRATHRRPGRRARVEHRPGRGRPTSTSASLGYAPG